MANFFSKVAIKVGAQSKKNRFDLSHYHITTQDFYRPKVAFMREMIPGETLNIKHVDVQSKLAPLHKPFFGNAAIQLRTFFVPFRTIMEGFNNFITGTPYCFSNGTNVIIPNVPLVKNSTLVSFFDNRLYTQVVSDSETTQYDYASKISNPSLGMRKFRLTTAGRVFWDILYTLGYKLDTNITQSNVDISYSALPLLAWAKIYQDWFKNPSYKDDVNFEKLFKGYRALTPLELSDVQQILNTTYAIAKSSDYFTSAWDNPLSPNNNLEANISVPDNTYSPIGRTVESVDVNAVNYNNRLSSEPVPNAPTIQEKNGDTDYPSSISQYMIDALKHVTDYVRRHQFVGSRVLDRYFGEYGIKLDSARLDRSYYLGRSTFNLQLGEVFNNAITDVDDAYLGQYAAKGVIKGSDSYKYKTDEYGYFMMIAYMTPNISYVDGRPRYLYHHDKFQFFTPEFDGLGCQAIRLDEIATSNKLSGNYILPNSVFGFTSRYAEYKVQQDQLSGSFALRSQDNWLKQWYLIQRYQQSDIADNNLPTKHNNAFLYGNSKYFHDPFYEDDDASEHFFTCFHFDVESYMPAKPLYDTYDFHSDGMKVLASVNGTKVTD